VPVSKQTRRSRHEQAENPTLKRGNPSSTEGRVGTQQFRNIPGKGLVHMVRADTGWKELGSSQSSTSKGDKVESITVSAGVSASSGASSGASASVHGNLTSLSEDDHSQYVHLSNVRTIDGNHTFTGIPVFNGGTPGSSAPFTVDSNYVVANLNADRWDGYEFSDYLNQDVKTTAAPTFATVNTGQGANELYAMNQNVRTTDAATFASVNTGQGFNELYDMNQNVLTTSDVTFNSLTTTADIIVDGDDITSNPFTSGFTGGGWKIDNTAHAEFSSASIRGTLSVYELLLQQLRATNGSVLITAVAKVESIDGNDITFEDPSDNGICPFHDNDIVMVQRADLTGTSGGDNGGGTLEIIRRLVRRVTSVSGRTITVTRDGDLPADTGSFGVGDDVVRIGNTTNTNRDAILYLSADDSKAPYMVIKDGVNSWANWGNPSTEKVRLGRLDGVTDTDAGLSGSQSNLYGLYSDSVYLKGHIFATSGEVGGIKMESNKLYVGTGTHGNANTGFYIDNGGDFSLKDKLTWDSSTSTLTVKGTFILENGDSVSAGVTWKGTYNAAVAYVKNDGVAYQGASYLATQSSTGQTPGSSSSYWDVMADQGSTGSNGNDGSNGTNGTNGTNGQDGATGQTGAQGSTGATGAAGSDGNDGADGDDGADGADGAPGQNGAPGAAGARGSRHYYYTVTGSSWSDSEANTAISGAGDTKVARDTVTLSKTNVFSATKYWDGDSWEAVAQVVDGNLIVHGTVGADQVDANDIFSVNITASNTITGGTLQTASSGQRLVMDGATNNLKFYDSGGSLNLELKSIAASSSFGGTQTGLEMANNGLIKIAGASNSADIYIKAKNTTNINTYGPDGFISVIPTNNSNVNSGKGGGYGGGIRCFNAGYDSAPLTNTGTAHFYGFHCKNTKYGAGTNIGMYSNMYSANGNDGENGTTYSYTNYAAYLSAYNSGTGSAYAVYVSSGIAAKSGGGDWSSTSDSRVKTIGDNYTTGLAEIIQLQPKHYKYNGLADHAPDDDIARVGLIAQEVESIIPSLVTDSVAEIDGVEVDDLKELDTSELKFAMINAIKELNERLTAIEQE